MSNMVSFTGSIPANYDKYLGPYLFEPYAIDLVQRLQNDSCKVILELACGTGRVTNHLVEILPEDGSLLATDLNPDMLTIAKSKVSDKRVEWQVVDALELPFDDASFDHIVCQFGVMFFPDKTKAFKEAYRALNEKGKFVFNTWGSLEENKRAGFIRDVLEDIFEEEAPDFLRKGPYSFYDPDAIKSNLTDAGFKSISVEQVKKVVEYRDVEEYINGFVDGTPLSAFLQQKDASVREEVKQKLRDALPQQFGESLASEMLAYVSIANKD
jgi:ubiquinone/menaquinone biosynthesis C-methylase UbiE